MSYCTYRMNTLAFWVLVLAAALGNSNADSLWDWEYCQTDNICSVGQGDCDRDAECEGTAVCGTNNCVDFDSSQHPSKEPYLYEFRKIFSFFDPPSLHPLSSFPADFHDQIPTISLTSNVFVDLLHPPPIADVICACSQRTAAGRMLSMTGTGAPTTCVAWAREIAIRMPNARGTWYAEPTTVKTSTLLCPMPWIAA